MAQSYDSERDSGGDPDHAPLLVAAQNATGDLGSPDGSAVRYNLERVVQAALVSGILPVVKPGWILVKPIHRASGAGAVVPDRHHAAGIDAAAFGQGLVEVEVAGRRCDLLEQNQGKWTSGPDVLKNKKPARSITT